MSPPPKGKTSHAWHWSFLLDHLQLLEGALSSQMRHLNHIYIYFCDNLCFLEVFLGKQLVIRFLKTFQTSLLLFYSLTSFTVFISLPSFFFKTTPFLPFPHQVTCNLLFLLQLLPQCLISNGPLILSWFLQLLLAISSHLKTRNWESSMRENMHIYLSVSG